MAKNCPRCGAPLGKRDKRCQACGYSEKQQKQTKSAKKEREGQRRRDTKQRPQKAPSGNRTLVRVIIGVVALAVIFGSIALLAKFNIIHLSFFGVKSVGLKLMQEDTSAQIIGYPVESGLPDYVDPTTMSDAEIQSAVEQSLKPVDADAYFNDRGTVVKKTPAASGAMTSETDTRKLMDDRGFKDYPVTTEYSDQGEYFEEKAISNYSSTLHPVYHMQYVDSSKRIWMLSVTNGRVSAFLVSQAFADTNPQSIYLSETDTLTGYDSATNTFYEYQPKADVCTVKKVTTVNAAALDAFSI